MESTKKHGIFLAVLAAALYALSSPFSNFREVPGVLFLAALALMAVGAWLSSGD